ncbi:MULTISPECIES: hypothetical protein [Xanthomonas]|uniref:Half a barrel domain-containing protein n=5 Tax=Xanthomonas TaxID=338 RepID=A0AAJ2WZW6_XANCA|nr:MULTISPECIES: hypothetical protein [Xanthomonas]MEB1846139.1 hypothetical protein [Xanthomonas campestris pv. campestris]APO97726.1 hypothetical protein BJD13_00625 [Xanthomonas perforans]APP78249.1 hypothetical protein BJD12_23275 [Xanthomonas vesicatoria ATCC 35937]APP87262.1 hypothetical protein BI317_24685 [Xanthomonas hortorum pv. gardneri]MDC8636269.1 hypothetical protein [Xanthomonas hortorum pv. hederae]
MNPSPILQHILAKSRAAAAGELGVLSTGEQIAAALALNRPDWLVAMGYTLAEAVDRLGADWLAQVPEAARQLADEAAKAADAHALEAQQLQLDALLEAPGDEPVRLLAEFVTYGNSPGYRDVDVHLRVTPLYLDIQAEPRLLALRIRPDDAPLIVDCISSVHAFAWHNERGPIDRRVGEVRPRWVPQYE